MFVFTLVDKKKNHEKDLLQGKSQKREDFAFFNFTNCNTTDFGESWDFTVEMKYRMSKVFLKVNENLLDANEERAHFMQIN